MLMKKIAVLLVLVLLIGSAAEAQFSRHIIRLKNKSGTPFSLNNPSAYLSARAIDRRLRYKIGIDSTDLPITPRYLDSIRLVPNVVILNSSKWLNQVLIQTTDAAALARINSFPFVLGSAPIASRTAPITPQGDKFAGRIDPVDPAYGIAGRTTADFFNYGNSYAQVHIHEGEYLHNEGFRGQGMQIAVFDAGFFQYQTNAIFDSIRANNQILGTWDFVAREPGVNEDHPHGMQCLSIIAANKPGSFVGTAPAAKFWLFRTEEAATEYPVEEQNWVAAAERADSLGVDMISSSLGYSDFDDPIFTYTHAQRNGNYSIVTRGADFAAKKGIIVMNSAGNSGGAGGELKFVACPADGDSVVAVAACDRFGAIAGFSSFGPNGAGKRKPNITSVGQGTVIAGFNGLPSAGSGTSFSNPNVAGLILCLWQAFPEFSNMEIIDAVQRNSSKFANPDDRFGYGIPNFKKAYEYLQNQRDFRNISVILKDDWIRVFPVPFKDAFKVALKGQRSSAANFHLYNSEGRLIYTKYVITTTGDYFIFDFNNLDLPAAGAYFLRFDDGKNRRTVKLVHY